MLGWIDEGLKGRSDCSKVLGPLSFALAFWDLGLGLGIKIGH